MITPPTGWTIERTADGVLIAPPEGPERAVLRYRERVRPLADVDELVAAAPVPRGFVETSASASRRLVTIEGEDAALVVRRGNRWLYHGYVFLDDHYAALEGVASDDIAPIVEELVVGDMHLLGWLRRRRVRYTQPPGWRVEADVFVARWYAPDRAAQIVVNPALPTSPGIVRAILDKLGATHAVAELFTSANDLRGEHYHLPELDLWFLEDDDFLYSVRGDGAADVGRALADSIEPVPRPRRPSVDALRFWVD